MLCGEKKDAEKDEELPWKVETERNKGVLKNQLEPKYTGLYQLC